MKRLLSTALVAGLLTTQALASHAFTGAQNFATFQGNTGAAGDFSLANSFDGSGTWLSSTLGATNYLGTNAAGNGFEFRVSSLPTLQPTPFGTFISAAVNFTATTGQGVIGASQVFTSVSQMTITAAGAQVVDGIAIPNGANLLTATVNTAIFSAGQLLGPGNLPGGQFVFSSQDSPFSANPANNGTFTSVEFSSAYLAFQYYPTPPVSQDVTQDQIGITIDSVDPASSVQVDPFGDFYYSAFADADHGEQTSINFGAAIPTAPTVPEPGLPAMMIVGISAAGLLRSRRAIKA